mmetsp:Transcript_36397/g.107449  ORF Transcript_36397/g.107449 Transcript_36397/m.107449 type:complete len:222 (-) Transcript_36397:620-1285(-)
MSLPRQRARNGVLSADVAARQPCPTANHEPQIMDEVAKQFGFQYSVRTADIDEKAIRHDDPHKLVLALARAKCDAILARMDASERATAGDGRGPFLLTCDQVVVYQGRILEKPEDQEECRSFIRGYANAPASTVGSVLCCDMETGHRFEAVDVSHIHFTPIPEGVVDKLLQEGDCMWCAGGLMVEHPLVVPHVVRIEGTQDGVMGLSKALVAKLLLQAAGL